MNEVFRLAGLGGIDRRDGEPAMRAWRWLQWALLGFSLLATAAVLLASAGAGFYWLEPGVHTYAEGVWLALESSATVGYGDMAPTTPASRVFAAFVVLLGYGLLSLVFASIAAIFVEQEERLLRREMHRDIKSLQAEIVGLRRDVHAMSGGSRATGEVADRRDPASDAHD